MVRRLSFSEIDTALTCWARWDFKYGGHLTGGVALEPKQLAARASAGAAWGAGVAAWHASGDLMGAHQALRDRFKRDVAEQFEHGFYLLPESEVKALNELGGALDHYAQTASRLQGLTLLEEPLDHPIPSRTGRRGSTKYRLHGYIDGSLTDMNGNEWLVEFKWRAPVGVEILQLSRQIRAYAWVRQQQTGRSVVGVIVDERYPTAPKPPKMVKGPRPSHDRRQLVTVDDYEQACREFGVEPKAASLQAYREREWQRRSPILFAPHDLDETGLELVTAGQLIRDLDSGRLYPLRVAKAQVCGGCRFLKACPVPRDRVFLSSLYDFRPPKRLRPAKPEERKIAA